MNILEELQALQQTANVGREQRPPVGYSYISDAVMQTSLYRLDVDESIITDVLLEPIEKRDDWLSYFEKLGVKK
jgi:hypothetical protein